MLGPLRRREQDIVRHAQCNALAPLDIHVSVDDAKRRLEKKLDDLNQQFGAGGISERFGQFFPQCRIAGAAHAEDLRH